MIVISYRRADSAGFTRALRERLVRQLGEERIFLDVETIEAGVAFRERLRDAISGAEALLVVIGRSWLAPPAAGGTASRLDDPNDVVRMEIATALGAGTRIIPVLVDGARMPAADQLPEPLRPLSERNAVVLSNERFEADVDRLLLALDRGHRRLVAATLAGLPLAGAVAYVLLAGRWTGYTAGLAGISFAAGAAVLVVLWRWPALAGRAGRAVGVGVALAVASLVLAGGIAYRQHIHDPFALTVRVHVAGGGAAPSPGGTMLLDLGEDRRRAALDAEGQAVFAGVPGSYVDEPITLTPLVPGYDTTATTGRVPPDHVMTIALHATHYATDVRGSVLDAQGVPMAGVQLDFGSGIASATTDASGHFAVTLPRAPGTVLPLRASAHGHVGYHDTVTIPEHTPLVIRFVVGG